MRNTLFLILGLGALLAIGAAAIPTKPAGDGLMRLAQTCPKGQRYDYQSQQCVKG
jgi:hypothetical protein